MMASRLKLVVAVLVGILVCGLILVTGPEPLTASIPESKPSVTVGPLERGVIPATVTAFGVLSPRQSLSLTTQVPGEVTWVSQNLDAGGELAKDEVLFRVDSRDYEIALASAEARFEEAEANIDLEEGLSENARLEWETWKKFNGQGAPRNPLALREPQQAGALAQLRVIRAAVDRARLDLERTEIRAPWPAAVVEANTVVGQVLGVGEVAATLFPLDYAVVEVQVPVSTLQLLESGIETVSLRPVHDPAGASVTGRYAGVVRYLTEGTRLATVRIRVDAPLANDSWAYGMHLAVTLVTRQQQDIAFVPADLIVSGNLVWVHRDGRARQHQVFPIRSEGSLVSVEDNFRAGDSLMLERPLGLFDGAAVDVLAAVRER